ncbi:predicted protein [Histoplasma mississippiense (nom. inval.)]|uniref:predicted protein n=1 Tax=Ajellomyces capsulatus (strain NAm1 / WU24) TaxID=2059318 RepID=UPI000157B540|nr:predicted protein [Histoplasma mississippiense (nom. inval.)]EDN02832.1 predicted protein [Histoplasma mississippiense (nom. inval.)]
MKINHKNRGRGKISRPENIHQDSGDVTAGMLISEITQQTFSQSAGQTTRDATPKKMIRQGKDEQMDPSKIRLIADLGRSGWRPPVTTLLAIAGISFKHIFSMYHWTGGAREFISGNQTKFASNSGDPEVNR